MNGAGWAPASIPALPWSGSPAEVRRFNRFLFATLFPALLISAIVPHLPVSEAPPQVMEDEKPRLVKLRFEPEPPPPPPVLEPAPVPAPVVAPRPAPQPPAPATSAARAEKPKAPEPKKVDRTAEIRQSLQRLRDNPAILSSLAERPLKQAVSADAPNNERLSAELDQGATESGRPTPRRQQGELALSGHASTRIAAPQAGSGHNDAQGDGRRQGGGGSGRSSQEIQSVFDRHKASINAIYERALRNDPQLAGKIVLRLTIEPSGEVSACSVIDNQLKDTTIAAQVVRRVKLFNFGAKAVPAVTIDYPIEFFPAR